jgi:putative toxin-antitoxin system antitoxin component (TIGR02293 family)
MTETTMPRFIEREKQNAGSAELQNVVSLLGGAQILRRRVNSPLDTHELLLQGLPEKALSHLVSGLTVIKWASLEKAVGMSLRTYQRRKEAPEKPLSQEQSERTWKFAEILAKASAVIGSQEDAEHWLKSPAIGLNQERPIDLLATRAGAEMVESFLKQLEYGVYV